MIRYDEGWRLVLRNGQGCGRRLVVSVKPSVEVVQSVGQRLVVCVHGSRRALIVSNFTDIPPHLLCILGVKGFLKFFLM